MSITIDSITFSSVTGFNTYVEQNGLRIENYMSPEDMMENDTVLVLSDIINPENEQHVRSGYIDADDVAYETAKIQLTRTTSYHRGFGVTKADQLYELIKDMDEVVELSEDFVEEYNDLVGAYNQYGDLPRIASGMTGWELLDSML